MLKTENGIEIKMQSSNMVLFVCAGLLLSGGALLGGATAWNLLRMSYLFWTTDLGAELGAMALFVAGSLLCLPICWLATILPYHRNSLPLMGTLIFMSTAALMLLTTGTSSMMGLSNTLRQTAAVNASMHRALVQAAVNPTVEDAFALMQIEELLPKTGTSSSMMGLSNTLAQAAVNPSVEDGFALMQIENKCCGINSYRDWQLFYRHSLPPSCCDRFKNNRSEICEKPLHNYGCLRPALYELRYFINSVSVLSSAIIIILAVTIFAVSYSLVSGLVARERPLPVHVACLCPSPAATPAAPPMVTLTSPAMLPSTMLQA